MSSRTVLTILFVVLMYIVMKVYFKEPTKSVEYTVDISEFKEEPRFITGFVLVRDSLKICNSILFVGHTCILFSNLKRADYQYNIKTKRLKISVDVLNEKIDTLEINKFIDIPSIQEEDLRFIRDTTIKTIYRNKPNEELSKQVLEKYVIKKITP